jgi:transcriptional regulator
MATHPQRLRQALTGGAPKTLKELSRELSLSEKDLVPLLDKLEQRSGQGAPLSIEPARCIGCGFEFRGRSRAAKPSRCPECRSERIAPPRFWIAAE